jgi:transposase
VEVVVMDVVHPRCAGLDIHKKSVVACRIVPGANDTPVKEIRSFGTLTRELLALADWLDEGGVTHVAMESTGSYWKPIYNLLEERFELLLANAAHLKAVPGRKTDVRDAEWIADLLRHGLLRPSFIPGRPERELRELVRYRTSLVRERAAELHRIAKVLEGANIKLGSVVRSLDGVSGRAMLGALAGGETEPAAVAKLADYRVRASRDTLEAALEGRVGRHQRFLLAAQLRHLGELEELIAGVSTEIEARLRPFDAHIERLTTIPGISRRTAEVVLAEIGPDMSRFGSARQLASWAGLCPGNYESAGKHKGGKTRKGSPWLRGALVTSATAAGRTKTYLGAQFRRLAARRGLKRAKVAVAHSLLLIIRAMLISGATFEDLGISYFDERDRELVQRRLTRRLEALGYRVSLSPAA